MNFKSFRMNKGAWIMAVMVALAVPGFAATSGTITLSGTVPGVLEIAVTPNAAASDLDLTVDTVDLLVASVNERSNRKAGYTVTVTSANAAAIMSGQAFLRSADLANPDVLPYGLSYNGAPVVFSGGSSVVSDTWARTSVAGVEKELRISYDGGAFFLNADDYADTLTFTIAAK